MLKLLLELVLRNDARARVRAMSLCVHWLVFRFGCINNKLNSESEGGRRNTATATSTQWQKRANYNNNERDTERETREREKDMHMHERKSWSGPKNRQQKRDRRESGAWGATASACVGVEERT